MGYINHRYCPVTKSPLVPHIAYSFQMMSNVNYPSKYLDKQYNQLKIQGNKKIVVALTKCKLVLLYRENYPLLYGV